MNSVVLVGRLTKDPELRYIPNSGTPVATFTIATDIPIEIIGKAAEFCANYITKGRLVAIQGNLRVDRYQTQDGENRTFTKVSGRSVQALDYPKDNQQGTNNITNPGLDPNGFQAIDDDDIPF